MVIFTELFGGTIFSFFKDSVKIRQIIEPTLVTYFRDAVCCIHQEPGCMSKADIDDIFRDRFPGSQFKKTTQGRWGHPHQVG